MAQRKTCKARKTLKNEHLIAKIGVDIAVYSVISLPRSSIFFSVRLGWDTVGPPLLSLPASFWEAPPATFRYEDNATHLPTTYREQAKAKNWVDQINVSLTVLKSRDGWILRWLDQDSIPLQQLTPFKNRLKLGLGVRRWAMGPAIGQLR